MEDVDISKQLKVYDLCAQLNKLRANVPGGGGVFFLYLGDPVMRVFRRESLLSLLAAVVCLPVTAIAYGSDVDLLKAGLENLARGEGSVLNARSRSVVAKTAVKVDWEMERIFQLVAAPRVLSSNDFPYECRDILSASNLPAHWCKFVYDSIDMEWYLDDANTPDNCHCQAPDFEPGDNDDPGIQYNYPCPDLPPPPDPIEPDPLDPMGPDPIPTPMGE